MQGKLRKSEIGGAVGEPGGCGDCRQPGNDHGAKGNYTLFHFSGEQLEMENLTLGNYCCVDLDYALDPAQSVKKEDRSHYAGTAGGYECR